jgi:hypothetical protein
MTDNNSFVKVEKDDDPLAQGFSKLMSDFKADMMYALDNKGYYKTIVQFSRPGVLDIVVNAMRELSTPESKVQMLMLYSDGDATFAKVEPMDLMKERMRREITPQALVKGTFNVTCRMYVPGAIEAVHDVLAEFASEEYKLVITKVNEGYVNVTVIKH